ncbi:MAG: hypothetical protein ACXV2F_04555 [Halobacteriota archaeon]
MSVTARTDISSEMRLAPIMEKRRCARGLRRIFAQALGAGNYKRVFAKHERYGWI